MNLEQVIETMNQVGGQEKTAEQQAPTTETELTAALEKVAGVPPAPAAPQESDDVIGSLMKMASDLAGTEKDAELSHMAMCGQAFADAAINRFSQYDAMAKRAMVEQTAILQPPIASPPAGSQPPVAEKVAAPIPVAVPADSEALKQAAAAGYNDAQQHVQNAELEKLAQHASGLSDNDLAKLAAEIGYQETLEKVAVEYKAGEDKALQEVHDTAASEFLKGAAEAEILLNQWRQSQQQQSQQG